MTTPPMPLMLIPGLVCDEVVWAAQAAAFGIERSVIIIDHGEHDSLPAMAQAALAIAPERFAIAGHSMGGRVALEMMRLAPERIAKLALLDTGYEALASGRAGEQEIAQRYSLLEIARARGMHAMGVEWARGMVHPGRLAEEPFMQRIHEMIARKTPEQFLAQIRALINRPDASDVLAAIRCPTLVLCGREDTWAPRSRHVEVASRIAGSTLLTVEECGHMAPMERPDEVTAALRAWLDERRHSSGR